jgi:uncharacterized integral membrane protein
VQEPPEGPKQVEPGGRPTARQVLGILVLVLVLVFAFVNLEDANIDFVVDQVTVPIFFVITVPALIGFVAGVLFQHHRARRRD